MKADPRVIGKILDARLRFCVPIYQRQYVWSVEKQLSLLWDDIRSKAIERLTRKDRKFLHFMGAIVLESKGGYTTEDVQTFQVVDGQQRLMTYQLFLAAARDYALASDFTEAAARISLYIFNGNQDLMKQREIEKFKVWPTKTDREMYSDILNMESHKMVRRKYNSHFYKKLAKIYTYKTVPKILHCYGFFYERIKGASESEEMDSASYGKNDHATILDIDTSADGYKLCNEDRFNAIWQSLIEEFGIVEITLDDGDDAQVIFETLNDRGEPLLAADLIRNYIFQRVDISLDKPEELFNKYWSIFESDFWKYEDRQGRYKKPRIELFLINYIAGMTADEINPRKLFSEYKSYVKRAHSESIEKELIQLSKYGTIYHELLSRGDVGHLSRFYKRLSPWDVTTVYPFVLRLWGCDSMEEDQKGAVLETLISYIVRRAVCNLTTKNYNKLFLSLIAQLDCSGWSLAGIHDFLVSLKSDSGRFPDDREFREAWTSKPVYNIMGSSKIRALLRDIETCKRTRFHEDISIPDNLTVEHVMPSWWIESWPLEDGTTISSQQFLQNQIFSTEDGTIEGMISKRERLKNTIGNLTLLTQPLNSKVSNGPFLNKKNEMLKTSLLILNKEIGAHQKWGESEIVARGEDLFESARLIWRRPDVE